MKAIFMTDAPHCKGMLTHLKTVQGYINTLKKAQDNYDNVVILDKSDNLLAFYAKPEKIYQKDTCIYNYFQFVWDYKLNQMMNATYYKNNPREIQFDEINRNK